MVMAAPGASAVRCPGAGQRHFAWQAVPMSGSVSRPVASAWSPAPLSSPAASSRRLAAPLAAGSGQQQQQWLQHPSSGSVHTRRHSGSLTCGPSLVGGMLSPCSTHRSNRHGGAFHLRPRSATGPLPGTAAASDEGTGGSRDKGVAPAASTAASSTSASNGGHPDAQGPAPSAMVGADTPELAQQQQQQQQSSSTSDAGEQVAAAGSEEPPAIPPATSLDGVPETQKYILADEWGYTAVGADLPEGTTPQLFAAMFPPQFFGFDAARAALSIALPLAVMAAGYGWLWYWHSICPLWQQLLCAIVIGTAYTGLFKVATECARFSFLPQAPVLQDSLGALIMAPSLYAIHSWRLGHLHHLLHMNMLWEDTWGWHPLTKVQLAGAILEGRKWTRAAWRVLLATPLKMLLGSLGHWLRHWDGCDLRRFEPNSRLAITISWAVPLLFAGFGLPAIAITGGASAVVSCWLLPWLVFHTWMGTLSLLQHTAPHIPFRAANDGYDWGRATICGTVTVRLPRWLETLLNNANYTLPQAVAPGMPFYHARAAYDMMKERLAPYLTEATLNVRLLTNHVTKWQVYDEDLHTYRPYDEVEGEVVGDLVQLFELMEGKKGKGEGAALGEQQQGAEGERGQEGEGGNGTGAGGLAPAPA